MCVVYRKISNFGLSSWTFLSLGQYSRKSVWDFPMKTSLLITFVGCWPRTKLRWLDTSQVLFFFFCLFMDLDRADVLKCKKRMRSISSHLDWTSLVNKGFIIWKIVLSSCGTQQVIRDVLDIWVIGQVCSQDGWILAKVFFCVFMDQCLLPEVTIGQNCYRMGIG